MTLKVIGAGLGRTGTLSLKLALEQLGFARCYHMAELFAAPEHTALWVEAAEGRPDWARLFEGFQATVDYPGCTFWRELANAYPDAKVLLSVRDPESWYESTQASIFSDANIARATESPAADFFEKTVFGDFGDRIHDRDFLIDYFRRWNARVEEAIPADRLLVYEVRQGWGPLCDFLGVATPDTPFPRTNTREDFAAMLADDHPADDPESVRRHLEGGADGE